MHSKYVPYDEVDKTDWVSIDVDFDDEIEDLLINFANNENRSIGDYLSKIIYENYFKKLNENKLDEFINNNSIIINKQMLELDESLSS